MPTSVRHPHRRRVATLERESATAAARDLGECVYAVITPDRLIKIGYTKALHQRIRGFGAKMQDIYLAIPADMAYEKALHARFKQYRARGHEYYFPVAEIMAWINAERALLGVSPIK